MPSVELTVGDCREVMRGLAAESIDAILCDPPYELGFMGKRWDNSGIAYDVEMWREAYRVLKPGAHLLAFGGSRTYHRLACAIEDAGFEIRDQLQWLYGSGFPKSLDVSRAMDKRGGNASLTSQIGREIKAARERRGMSATECDRIFCGGSTNWSWFEGRPTGQRAPTPETFARIVAAWPELAPLAAMVDEAEREITGHSTNGIAGGTGRHAGEDGAYGFGGEYDITAPATDLAHRWQGFGTALKPAHEPIVLARKPLIGTVAANVTEHGTGALNIDGCRIESGASDDALRVRHNNAGTGDIEQWRTGKRESDTGGSPLGRWPANVVLGHSPECREVGVKRVKGSGRSARGGVSGNKVYGEFAEATRYECGYGDEDGYETVTAWECAPDCAVALLDAQSGERPAGGKVTGRQKSRTGDSGIYGAYNAKENSPYNDTGGASRFFLNVAPDDAWYICESDGIVSHIADLTSGCPECGATMVPYRVPIEGDEARFRYEAKASRAERNAGLDGMPERKSSDDGYGSIQQPILDRVAPRDNWQPHKTANHHPTVKPISLMRWLCKLITPPGGLVLDPFLGSGSTGCAAMYEGFDFLGCDLDAEYVEIARRRIAHHAALAEKARESGSPQLALFDGEAA